MRTPQSAKAWGRTVENRALLILQAVWPRLRRIGTGGYSKAHPDLLFTGDPELATLHLVVTQDYYSYPLVTLDLRQFVNFLDKAQLPYPVAVQVKARSTTWVGSLMRDLKRAYP